MVGMDHDIQPSVGGLGSEVLDVPGKTEPRVIPVSHCTHQRPMMDPWRRSFGRILLNEKA